MFIRSFMPLYAPDNEGQGGDEVETEVLDQGQDTGDQGGDEGQQEQQEKPDGPGSGRSALRKSLEKGFENGRKQEQAQAAKGRGASKGQAHRVGDRAAPPAAKGQEGEVQEGQEDQEPQEGQQAVALPEGFAKELAPEWAKTPPAVQQGILKRIDDMNKGAVQIKEKYADIDRALQPHLESIRRHGRTPAEAVNTLFTWFQALAGNPGQAFPALAASFNYDWNKIKGLPSYGAAAQPGQQPAQPGQTNGQQQPGQAGDQPPGDIPPALQAYINQLNERLAMMGQQSDQRFNTLAQSFQQSQEAKASENVNIWAKDKPHFADVRGMMAHLIQSGIVPLKAGQVDLDGAYEMAIFSHPEVRAKVLAEQEAAKVAAAKKATEDAAKKRQADADKARKASGSVIGGAPGADAQQRQRKPGQRKSVRDSLREAIEEHSDV